MAIKLGTSTPSTYKLGSASVSKIFLGTSQVWPAVVAISSQPSNQTASSGAATFSVTASVTQSATLTYQWQKSTNNGSTWTNVSGATSSSLALSSLTSGDNSSQYRVIVSATDGAASVTSNAATLTVASSFTPAAVLLTSGTSYTVPSGATSMKAWAVGQGGAVARSDWNTLGVGGCAYKTWSVTGGGAVSFVVGKNAAVSKLMGGTYGSTMKVANGADTTVTYAGVTITGGGAVTYTTSGSTNTFAIAGGTFSGGDGGVNGTAKIDTRNGYWTTGPALGGNGGSISGPCYRRAATDISGLLAAVALAGGKATENCAAVPAFGSGAAYDIKYGDTSRGGYGAPWDGGNLPANLTYTGGAVVLYFT